MAQRSIRSCDFVLNAFHVLFWASTNVKIPLAFYMRNFSRIWIVDCSHKQLEDVI